MKSISQEKLDSLIKDKALRIHFVGIGGTGMSSYSLFRAMSGGKTSGSDRNFDQQNNLSMYNTLLSQNILIFPQDGSGVLGAAAIVVSAAIESTVSDYAVAIENGTLVITRKEWLAAHYRIYKCVAVTGTSGKSTVTAMIFEMLNKCGYDPGLIAGAELLSLTNTNKPGCAKIGSGLLVIEADESDKGIGDYTPHVGVILNLQRDHDEPENMIPALSSFVINCLSKCIISEDPALASFQNDAVVFGETANEPYRYSDIELGSDHSSFVMAGQKFTLPVPGLHNVQNAAAAISVGQFLGLKLADIAQAFETYQGLARRFELVGKGNGMEVIDDYAHNPAKIAAVIKTAAARGKRTILWYQPHGFGPTRFMRHDLVATFASTLRTHDELYIAPIYYAGGTAAKDISSFDLIDDLSSLNRLAYSANTREDFITQMKEISRPGDVIVIVGARDPSLPTLARNLAKALNIAHLDDRTAF